VWGYDFDPETNVVDVYIRRVRSKIDTDDGPSLIETVRGVGYRFRRGDEAA
jgi:DNA-binding response OmpR family regulator